MLCKQWRTTCRFPPDKCKWMKSYLKNDVLFIQWSQNNHDDFTKIISNELPNFKGVVMACKTTQTLIFLLISGSCSEDWAVTYTLQEYNTFIWTFTWHSEEVLWPGTDWWATVKSSVFMVKCKDSSVCLSINISGDWTPNHWQVGNRKTPHMLTGCSM